MTAKSLRVVLVTAAGMASLLGPGCGAGGGTGPAAPVIAMTASASGDGQSALVGTPLPNPLRVVVTLSGAPQAGKTVNWAASGTAARVDPAASVTDANGIATTTWTLATAAGPQSATASLAGATGSPVTFSATATAVPVPVLQKTSSASGDGQSGTVATTLANPLRVLVTLGGAAQGGDTVTWAASGAAASVSPTKAVTDASGIATATWTLGQSAGSQSATATLAGATGSPVTFSATAVPGPATQLSLSGGDNQSAVVNTTFTSPLAVKVGDQFGNGVAGDTVTWAVTGGSASVLASQSVSGATGVAETAATAGGTAGSITITATSGALSGSPVTFHATATTVPTAASVSVGNFFFKSGHNATQNPAVDTVAVNGTVTWTWTGGTHGVQSLGSPSFTDSPTQSSGSYMFTFTAAGTYQYDCTVHGLAMTGTIVVR
jgi:plastocyanin